MRWACEEVLVVVVVVAVVSVAQARGERAAFLQCGLVLLLWHVVLLLEEQMTGSCVSPPIQAVVVWLLSSSV